MKRTKRVGLREAREARGWTQAQLADETRRIDDKGQGVNQTHISKIERRGVVDPKNSTVELLELALRVERGTLVFGPPASEVVAP